RLGLALHVHQAAAGDHPAVVEHPARGLEVVGCRGGVAVGTGCGDGGHRVASSAMGPLPSPPAVAAGPGGEVGVSVASASAASLASAASEGADPVRVRNTSSRVGWRRL